ncbi:hypothetical protein DACRYDRAFT_17239 [Dacryopinax primogenitus]|uniref:Uncharacterized protein n=1 Tax=Dacryopinax primogenitus (strain DJM 731) TaxID=1858805 RepID=M5G719_DACPD|nr:uncharacterized protein DACRYDRAFT_17239 [Dacryopinax primogenitus]EJT99557.1 hypothetical protein DACRYDRAFT_17239 [Dacryopinax primogenitus]
MEQEEAKGAVAVEAAVVVDVMEKKEDKPKHPKPHQIFQKTATMSPPNNSDEVEFMDNVPPGRATEQLATFMPRVHPPQGRGNTMESDMVEVVVPQRVMVKPICPINTKASKSMKNKGKARLSTWNAPELTNRLAKGFTLKAKPTTVAKGFQLLWTLYSLWWEVALLKCKECAKEDKRKGHVVRKTNSLAKVPNEGREWPKVVKPAKWEQVCVLLRQASSWLLMASTAMNEWVMEICLNQASLMFVLNTSHDEILYVHLPCKDTFAPMGMQYEMNLGTVKLINKGMKKCKAKDDDASTLQDIKKAKLMEHSGWSTSVPAELIYLSSDEEEPPYEEESLGAGTDEDEGPNSGLVGDRCGQGHPISHSIGICVIERSSDLSFYFSNMYGSEGLTPSAGNFRIVVPSGDDIRESKKSRVLARWDILGYCGVGRVILNAKTVMVCYIEEGLESWVKEIEDQLAEVVRQQAKRCNGIPSDATIKFRYHVRFAFIMADDNIGA